MKKIISLFQRNHDGDRLVRDEVTPGAEWVIAGEGVPTRKWDGTCCRIEGGKLWKRYEVKKGGNAPDGFDPATDVDEVTGKIQGWLPVGAGPEDRWHREAFEIGSSFSGVVAGTQTKALPLDAGTYELIGPKIQGNPDKALRHVLIKHGACPVFAFPADFDGMRLFLSISEIEGVVWHHPDGRMAKIKAKDFGIKRPKIA